jgi:hypothetical protein
MAVALCAGAAIPAAAQQEGGELEMSAEMLAEMNAWMKLAQPGPHHEPIQALEGRWKGEVTMWMGPDAPPLKETAEAEGELILGGRFLLWKSTGQFGGMPFEGLVIEGYNNGDERYESIWMDNFGTLMMFFTGTSSDDGKRREMKSQFNDVVAGGVVDYRAVFQWADADHFTYTAFMGRDEGEFKNVEISWSRQ